MNNDYNWRGPESHGGNYGQYGTANQQSQRHGNVSGFGSTYGANYSGRQGGAPNQYANRVNQPMNRTSNPGGSQSQQGTGQNQWRGERRNTQGNSQSLMGFNDFDRY